MIGSRRFALASVRSVRVDSLERSGLIGSLAGATLFLLGACLIVTAIVGLVLLPKFLIGVAMLALVGCCGLQDVWSERGSGFYRLLLITDGGEVEAYLSPDRDETISLAGDVKALLGRRADR